MFIDTWKESYKTVANYSKVMKTYFQINVKYSNTWLSVVIKVVYILYIAQYNKMNNLKKMDSYWCCIISQSNFTDAFIVSYMHNSNFTGNIDSVSGILYYDTVIIQFFLLCHCCQKDYQFINKSFLLSSKII